MGRKCIGDKPLTAQERKARYKEKMKHNPQKLEEGRRKERERWKSRVEEKKVLLIKDCSKRERRSRRKKWREAFNRSKERRILENLKTPPTSPEPVHQLADIPAPFVEPVSSDKRKESGMKKILRNRSKTARDLDSALEKLQRTETQVKKI